MNTVVSGLFIPVVVLLLAGAGVGAFAFWVWMLVDCAVYEPSEGNDRIVWVLIIILTSWIGALIYLLVRRPERRRRFGR